MKLEKLRPIVLAALLVILVGVGWLEFWPRAAVAPSAVPGKRDADAAGATPLPRIALSRLDAKPAAPVAGGTDVFEFQARHVPVAAAQVPPPPVVVAEAPLPVVSPTPPPVPVMNVKYIGNVKNKKGLSVAVLMTDRKEVLTGRPGDIVANRLKIVSIGLESVDVQDVGSDHVRRIPLRAN